MAIMAAWAVFAAAFLFRPRAARARSQRRAPAALAGILLQASAMSLIWGVRRTPLASPLLSPPALDLALALLAVLTGWTSVGLIMWAIRTLGRQWAVAARLVDGHELITTGPYAMVRNPIYLGFFGLAVATGIVVSKPAAVLAALPLFIAGTLVRVRAEEQLLRRQFGAAFDRFTARVPALVPRFVIRSDRDS